MNTHLINWTESLTITQDQFTKIAADNRDLRLEKTAQGEVFRLSERFQVVCLINKSLRTNK